MRGAPKGDVAKAVENLCGGLLFLVEMLPAGEKSLRGALEL